jgi:hypothetical protein
VRIRSVLPLLIFVILGGCGDEGAENAGSRTPPAVYGREPAGPNDRTDGPGLVMPSLVPANLKEACDILGPLIPGGRVKPSPFVWFDFIGQLNQLIKLSDGEAAEALTPLTPFPVLYFERAGHGGPSQSVQAQWRSELKAVSSRCEEAGSSAFQVES